MKRLVLFFAVVLLSGCATIGNINKFARLEPQLEKLVVLKSQTPVGGQQVVYLCGENPDELAFLTAAASQMGWSAVGPGVKIEGVPTGCVSVSYSSPLSVK